MEDLAQAVELAGHGKRPRRTLIGNEISSTHDTQQGCQKPKHSTSLTIKWGDVQIYKRATLVTIKWTHTYIVYDFFI